MLSALGCREDALAAAEEAVRTLAPFFLRLPDAFEHWMAIFVPHYRQLAEDAGRPVDEELLRPVVELLDRQG